MLAPVPKLFIWVWDGIIVCIIHPTECTAAQPSKGGKGTLQQKLSDRGVLPQPDASREAVH